MATANATIVGELKEVSNNLMQKENNRAFGGIDGNLSRRPDYYVYLFTISKREWTIERPPLFPRITVPACEKNERYKSWGRIPSPYQQAVYNEDNGRLQAGPEPPTGERCATDLINPNNLTNNQDWVCPPAAALAYGCNLAEQGLFWSLNEIPTEEELSRAEARLRKRQKFVIDTVTNASADPKLVRELVQDVEYHYAMDAFGEESEFHKSTKVPCAKCGEPTKPGVGFHQNREIGFLCVTDWRAAVNAGLKRRDDVPEDARWWSEADEEPKRGPGRPRINP